MADEIKDEPIVDDEAALDKELADSIESVKAGNTLTPEKEEVKPEAKSEGEIPKEEPKVESPEAAPTADPEEKSKYEFRVPNKGKFESDESFEKRTELLDLVKRRKLATTPEAKAALSQEIQTAKNQLKNLNGSDKINNPSNPGEPEKTAPEEDEATKADKERLKQLGGATKEDIQLMLQEERQVIETKTTLDRFVDRHPDLQDPDVREVFFDFVDSNFNWNGKTSKELMTVLELAREAMFKPSETIQDRVLKGANVQEKINAMQFPGGTIAKQSHSPEIQKSIDELKATGMTEEKALELLAD